ncbi:MAG: response regulator [Beijerinckiaceae bacterium]|nr:response regulator [Beijerinckiaceae bacterium]
MSGPRILLIEASPSLRAHVSARLVKHGYQVNSLGSMAGARLMLDLFQPHAVLLDLSLDDGDGLALTPEIIRRSIPVIVMSSRAATMDRIRAFQHGVDDYLVKPVDLSELLLRLSRHCAPASRAVEPAKPIPLGGALIDVDKRTIICSDHRRILLTASELRLLRLFLDDRNVALSKHTIARLALLNSGLDDSRAVEMMVSKLRRKLAAVGEGHGIRNVRSEGYLLAGPIATPDAALVTQGQASGFDAPEKRDE